MCGTCGIVVSRLDIVGASLISDVQHKECLRPVRHDGPHLIRRDSGEYVVWEDDDECNCELCMGEDPCDNCLIFGEVSDEEALLLISSGECTGENKSP